MNHRWIATFLLLSFSSVAYGSSAKTPSTCPDLLAQTLTPGGNATMLKLVKKIEQTAQRNALTLITGDNGTGKEVVATLLVDHSPRKKNFVTFNSTAIPRDLYESALFGHLKGSFTGATASVKGKFMEAQGGTLFIDEIGDMPLEAQAKLLRVLQDQVVTPIGGSASDAKKIDVRIITATNKNLLKEVQAGRFREDLYYRIKVLHLHIPPLREHPEDILPLAAQFLKKAAEAHGKRFPSISAEAVNALNHHRWPGNVRELENAMIRAAVYTPDGESVTAEYFELEGDSGTQTDAAASEITPPTPVTKPYALNFSGEDKKTPSAGSTSSESSDNGHGLQLSLAINEVRRIWLETALARTRWNMNEASTLLGFTGTTVKKWIGDFNLTQPPANQMEEWAAQVAGKTDFILPGKLAESNLLIPNGDLTVSQAIEKLKTLFIIEALRRTKGDKPEAAAILGIRTGKLNCMITDLKIITD